jgi:hypothetical protein
MPMPACRDHIGKELSSYYCNYSNDTHARSKDLAREEDSARQIGLDLTIDCP